MAILLYLIFKDNLIVHFAVSLTYSKLSCRTSSSVTKILTFFFTSFTTSNLREVISSVETPRTPYLYYEDSKQDQLVDDLVLSNSSYCEILRGELSWIRWTTSSLSRLSTNDSCEETSFLNQLSTSTSCTKLDTSKKSTLS